MALFDTNKIYFLVEYLDYTNEITANNKYLST